MLLVHGSTEVLGCQTGQCTPRTTTCSITSGLRIQFGSLSYGSTRFRTKGRERLKADTPARHSSRVISSSITSRLQHTTQYPRGQTQPKIIICVDCRDYIRTSSALSTSHRQVSESSALHRPAILVSDARNWRFSTIWTSTRYHKPKHLVGSQHLSRARAAREVAAPRRPLCATRRSTKETTERETERERERARRRGCPPRCSAAWPICHSPHLLAMTLHDLSTMPAAKRSSPEHAEYFNDLTQAVPNGDPNSPESLPENHQAGSQANRSDALDGVPRPKRIACVVCRKRKLKCDGAKPRCRTCSRLGHECAYDEVRRKSGPKRGYVKALEARLGMRLVGTFIVETARARKDEWPTLTVVPANGCSSGRDASEEPG